MNKYIEINRTRLTKQDGFFIGDELELSEPDIIIHRVEYIKYEARTNIFSGGVENVIGDK